MNFELLHQFGQSYPEEFDGSLDSGSVATTCVFNRRGTLLAVGCNDGRIVIWDFLTRGICKIIQAHVHPIASLSWSRHGQFVVSASTDNTVCIWDVASSDCVYRWRFPCPTVKVQFNPRNDRMILVCPSRHQAVLVFRPAENQPPQNHVVLPVDEDSDLNIIASFDRRGQYIYCGNAKGKIIVIKVDEMGTNLNIVASFRIASSNIVIKQIEFAPKRKDIFLVNASDRIIRVYETREVLTCGVNGEPEPVQRIQDQVNKTTWKKCCFSGGPDADYICAGSARQHSLCIYDRSVGGLVKILQGTKGETLVDVVWHPLRSIIASISSGVVSIWAQAQIENWSAFAPDFKELDENVEYEERESEFDVEDEDRSPTRNIQDNDDEDEEVDVVGVQPSSHFLSSDEDETLEQDGLLYLPISLELDEGGMNDPGSHNYFGKDGNESSPSTKNPRKAKTVDVDLRDSAREGASKQTSRSTGNDRFKSKSVRTSSKRNLQGSESTNGTKKKRRLANYDPPYEMS